MNINGTDYRRAGDLKVGEIIKIRGQNISMTEAHWHTCLIVSIERPYSDKCQIKVGLLGENGYMVQGLFEYDAVNHESYFVRCV